MSRNKAATLGMPHGTANNKLRKAIMFKYVKLANEHYCFRCGAEIESVDDISIEHKMPWEGISADLFFDVDNIAFSHRECNRPNRPPSPRVNTIEGQKRCNVCLTYKPLDNFHKNSYNKRDGRQSHCKDCHKTWRSR